ncbi:MAG: hydroxymethylpyrimidine/phosphomethylpyrimidine kinase [Motiliproteus sp.]|jgi:hydroxymethylpyrimidine/phosphomethylpyrimidine kinase
MVNKMALPCVLAVSGSDSSAGAGLQADLKACAALGVYAATAVTAITAQNSLGVGSVEPVSALMVKRQMLAVLQDLSVSVIKIGMLGEASIVEAVSEVLDDYPEIPVVLDPVLVSSSGRLLLDIAGRQLMVQRLFRQVTLLTPNVAEAAYLSGIIEEEIDADPEHAMRAMADLGVGAVLLKGGHRSGDCSEDLLWMNGCLHRYSAPRLVVQNSHGTGCTLAAAIAANLAKGMGLSDAVAAAKTYLTRTLQTADRFALGQGQGSLNHFEW